MGKILIPASSPEDWKIFLADPGKQWKSGYSARALAYCWQEAGGDLPSDIASVLSQSDRLRGLEVVFVVPEYQVPLPGGSRPSQNDIWVLGRIAHGLVSITVEGKVSEPFGPTIDEWLVGGSAGKVKRLRFLCAELGLVYPPPEDVRYQLFHRTVSAIVEAKRLRARDAVMLVHSFSPANEWFEDYRRFLALFGMDGGVDEIASMGIPADLMLHLGWVHGAEKYLRA